MFFDSHSRLAFTKIRYLRPLPTRRQAATKNETRPGPPPPGQNAGRASRPASPRRPAAAGDWLLKLTFAAAIVATMILIVHGCQRQATGNNDRIKLYHPTDIPPLEAGGQAGSPDVHRDVINAQRHGAGDAAGSARPELTLETAWLIVWSAESDCGQNLARGDGGRARGHGQYRMARWDELCSKTGRNYRWPEDCYDLEKTRDLTTAGWMIERPDEIAAGDVETLVRCHRLPRKPHRKDNDEYWRRACTKARLYAALNRKNTATDGQTIGELSANTKEAWAAVATITTESQIANDDSQIKLTEADLGLTRREAACAGRQERGPGRIISDGRAANK